jgi:hypothetical protein
MAVFTSACGVLDFSIIYRKKKKRETGNSNKKPHKMRRRN